MRLASSGSLGSKADLHWRQFDRERFELRLSGPFGAGAVSIAGMSDGNHGVYLAIAAPPEVAQALDMCGFPWKSVSTIEVAARLEPEDGCDSETLRRRLCSIPER